MRPSIVAKGLPALLAIALVALVCFMEFGSVYKQSCGEEAVFRTRMGLYVCEANDEAAEDFSCSRKLAGLGGYFMLRDLTAAECRAPDRPRIGAQRDP